MIILPLPDIPLLPLGADSAHCRLPLCLGPSQPLLARHGPCSTPVEGPPPRPKSTSASPLPSSLPTAPSLDSGLNPKVGKSKASSH